MYNDERAGVGTRKTKFFEKTWFIFVQGNFLRLPLTTVGANLRVRPP